MIKLERTCYACPEQYDAYDEKGKRVGYLRLRHGTFRVDCPDCGEQEVYVAHPKGDGIFYDEERNYYLSCAVDAIERWIKGEFTDRLPDPPKVEFTVVNEFKEEEESK
jgi:hypothetical protein